MIRAQRLTKCFGQFTAIEDVSFTVETGEIVGFLGPNGAGKTTTMRILAGVFPPTSGRAVVAGHDVVAEGLRARRAVGYFPERISLYLDMTACEYLEYVGRLKEIPAAARRQAIAEAMTACGIRHVAQRMLGSLSKGYRQRVGIAQAVLGAPQVLILDEPTAGLDPEQVAEMRALIRSLRGNRTVILSTHILSEVEATCDRVMIIHRGRLLAVDTPENLNRRLRHRTAIHVELEAPEDAALDHLRRIPGVLHIEPLRHPGDSVAFAISTNNEKDAAAAIAEAVVRSGWKLRELRHTTLSLEEIFLSLVSGQAESATATATPPPTV